MYGPLRKLSVSLLLLILIDAASAVDYEIDTVVFYSQGTRLSGSIIYPMSKPIEAAVVFVHGSGKQQRNIDLAKEFAAKWSSCVGL